MIVCSVVQHVRCTDGMTGGGHEWRRISRAISRPYCSLQHIDAVYKCMYGAIIRHSFKDKNSCSRLVGVCRRRLRHRIAVRQRLDPLCLHPADDLGGDLGQHLLGEELLVPDVAAADELAHLDELHDVALGGAARVTQYLAVRVLEGQR